MFYASFGTEVLRIGRVSTSQESFFASSEAVISRAIKQGAKINRLRKCLKKNFGRQDVLQRFSENASTFADTLLAGR